jgi:uncharacterized protein YbbC (DUF1343 family)
MHEDTLVFDIQDADALYTYTVTLAYAMAKPRNAT